MDKFSSPEYKRSRKAYMAQCTFEYFISLLVADAFLAKLLTAVGISDALAGIISSFVTLAFIFQLLSLFLVKLKVSTKKLTCLLDTSSIFCFMLIFLVPFMPFSLTGKTVIVVLSVFSAYILKYIVHSMFFKWANSFVAPNKRAEYSAVKETISLATGIVFTFVVSYIVDKFEGLGNLNGAFLFIASAILILNICNLVSLLLIKKDDPSEKVTDAPMKDVVRGTLGNKNFRNIIILTILWDITRYFTIGFMGVFKTNDLLFSVFTIQVINIIANCARMAISKPFGRYSDKHSFTKGFELALYLAAGAFLINIFTTNSTRWLIVIFTVLFNCSYAGTNQNSFNITYSYVKSEYISQAMALKNSVGGICGFCSALVAGKLLAFVQQNGNTIFGIHVYGQQVLSCISFIFAVITIIFLRTKIAKQDRIIQ